MMYQDDNLLFNAESIGIMAKEYAEKLERKEKEMFLKPLEDLLKNLYILENLYNNLLKYAKTSALDFTKNLLKLTDYQIIKIREEMKYDNEIDFVKTSTNHYSDIFKHCISYEILSLKSCILCENIENNSKKSDFFKKIEEITFKKINMLINCI